MGISTARARVVSFHQRRWEAVMAGTGRVKAELVLTEDERVDP